MRSQTCDWHLLAALVLTGACQSNDAPKPPAAQFEFPTKADRPPIDSAKVGELAEGPEVAFGLPIPRNMRVKAKMTDAFYATGNLKLEHVSNYVRQRVSSGRIDTGPAKTVFYLASLIADPEKILEIEVSSHQSGAQIIVRNKTRPAADEGLTEAQRWERAGLTPSGKVIGNRLE